ncbi:MAG TPA: patatin-like phospholipase family protein [Vicinamibacterales bacterium]|nr:patatin-like phospholipase family protein [Vicinamibacterales bacterium]
MDAQVLDATTVAYQKRAAERRSLMEDAKAALRSGGGTPEEDHDLAIKLKKHDLFDFACRLLARARQKPTHDKKLRRELAQTHALCTYKNPDAPLVERLEDALRLLEEEEDLRTTTDQETLGIAGAIFKRRWQADGRKENLETSFEYYRRGYDVGPDQDDGYTGINAACVLDLLGDIEVRQAVRTGGNTSQVQDRKPQATAIRHEVIKALLAKRDKETQQSPPPNKPFDSKWWCVATLAEAYFGLEEFENAGKWLAVGQQIKDIPVWEFNSTARQLAMLARLQSKMSVTRSAGHVSGDPLCDPQSVTESPAWQLLQQFLGISPMAIRSSALGKVGLALSGGGFRASLFHIGVLASLAEHDLLRHVEVLSCVSGGSILGTHYYLELQRLLETKPDAAITREDYVDIVDRVASSFLEGVQQNIRMRTFGNPWDNLRMFFSRAYSRTHKVGEMYERHLYSRVARNGGRPARFIGDLRIRPAETSPGFHPRDENWRRAAKVPALVVNTSSLNSGHQWQFTTSFMGEPPSIINTKVDGNYRLRRMYYDQAPAPYGQIRLGYAVGASSCVPGLFEPLQFHGMFKDIAVTLVDGGVHDNQGILSLLEQDCDHLIISDASGQMGEVDEPGVGPLPVLYRSDAIFQTRMRDLAYRDLASRVRGGVVSATYMHLKQGLQVTPKDWVECDDPKENPLATSTAVRFTAYDVREDVQRLLADIRTDLDSFCDAEAHALMTSGYRMTAHNLKQRGFKLAGEHDWKFLYIEQAMRTGNQRLMDILEQSDGLAFKIWRLSRPLRMVGVVLLALAFAVAVYAAWTMRDPAKDIPLLTVGGLLTTLVLFVLTAVLGRVVGRILDAPGWLKRAAIGVGAAIAGWAIVGIHLLWFDRLYLRYGNRSHF